MRGRLLGPPLFFPELIKTFLVHSAGVGGREIKYER